jgi:hypothetical protein
MSNEKFKVKFGLAVGDTQATIDGTNGDISTLGDVDVKGGNITNSTGALDIATTGGTNLSFSPASPGQTVVNSPFDVNGNITCDLINIDNITIDGNTISSTDTNGDIILLTNGTGDIDLVADTIQVGDSNVNATITTNGTGNLILNTNGGTNAGTLTLANGANGAITLDPDGTGNVVLTLANGGNLTNSRNYVFGAIRNATTQSNGDIWVLDADSGGAGTLPVRGVSIDNSTDFATKNAGVVMRNYSNTGGFSPRVVFERSRYTGTPATPLTLSSGDTIGTIASTGYSSTLGWINDTLPFAPAVINTVTTEAWASNTNLGTQLSVLLTPIATTMTTAANLIAVIAANPQTFASRSDAFTWAKGKTSTQNLMTLNDQSSKVTLSVNQVRATSGADTAQTNFTVYRSADGVNYTPTQSGDLIGNFKFNGNANTSTSPGVPAGPGAQITAAATETWTASANGTKINFFAIKTGTTTEVNVIEANPTSTTFRSDAFTFKDSAGTNIVGSKIDYNRVYGQFQYDTTVTPVAADTAYVFPLGTADINNIATVGSTSRLIAGAAGIYNLQFSIQVDNVDNSNDHDAYIWLRKNGTDVTGSMGRTTVPKNNAGSLKIIAWNYIVSSANTTDYWEIAYAVSDTDVTFPAFAATAFGPSTATIIISLTPVGA